MEAPIDLGQNHSRPPGVGRSNPGSDIEVAMISLAKPSLPFTVL
jgi:hypothetical protein